MVTLHAQIIKKDGKKHYVVLPYEEFLELQEELEDYAPDFSHYALEMT